MWTWKRASGAIRRDFIVARAGEIADFTGVSAPYERPFAPELVLDTAHFNIDHCVRRLAEYVERVTGLKAAKPAH